jgi:hypothetical protein
MSHPTFDARACPRRDGRVTNDQRAPKNDVPNIRASVANPSDDVGEGPPGVKQFDSGGSGEDEHSQSRRGRDGDVWLNVDYEITFLLGITMKARGVEGQDLGVCETRDRCFQLPEEVREHSRGRRRRAGRGKGVMWKRNGGEMKPSAGRISLYPRPHRPDSTSTRPQERFTAASVEPRPQVIASSPRGPLIQSALS